jgi:hypothetical protein
MAKQQRHYISYLLRLWQVCSGGRLIWRASLERADTRERRGFTSLDNLFEFLREQTETATEMNEEAEETGE